MTDGGPSSTLTITELTLDKSGYYSCRASNDYSTIWTDDAHVNVQKTTEDLCSPSPESHLITLRDGCLYEGSNVIDVGVCPRYSCHLSSDELTNGCKDEQTSCCGPVSHIVVDAVCGDGHTLPLFVVMECGCIQCPDRNVLVTGTVNDVYGSALGDVTIASILATTTVDGEFSFEISPGTPRLPLVFFDETPRGFIDTVYVAEIYRDTEVLPITITLLQESVEVHSSTEETQIQYPLTNSYISIPANSFYQPGGEFYKVSTF